MSEFVEFIAFSSWKAFTGYFLFISEIPEDQFQIELSSGNTLADAVVEMEGLANFVVDSMLGDKDDDREDTFSFDVTKWATIQASAGKEQLLQGLERGFVRLHHALEESKEEDICKHFAMWQPSGMSTPAFAAMRLAQDQAFQKGQLVCLLKESPL